MPPAARMATSSGPASDGEPAHLLDELDEVGPVRHRGRVERAPVTAGLGPLDAQPVDAGLERRPRLVDVGDGDDALDAGPAQLPEHRRRGQPEGEGDGGDPLAHDEVELALPVVGVAGSRLPRLGAQRGSLVEEGLPVGRDGGGAVGTGETSGPHGIPVGGVGDEEVDAEGARGEVPDPRDLRRELLRREVAAGEEAEAARLADGCDEVGRRRAAGHRGRHDAGVDRAQGHPATLLRRAPRVSGGARPASRPRPAPSTRRRGRRSRRRGSGRSRARTTGRGSRP